MSQTRYHDTSIDKPIAKTRVADGPPPLPLEAPRAGLPSHFAPKSEESRDITSIVLVVMIALVAMFACIGVYSHKLDAVRDEQVKWLGQSLITEGEWLTYIRKVEAQDKMLINRDAKMLVHMDNAVTDALWALDTVEVLSRYVPPEIQKQLKVSIDKHNATNDERKAKMAAETDDELIADADKIREEHSK